MPPVFHPITGEKLPAGYTLAAETNRYDYTDDQGIRRSIHMPKGTASAARRYAAENNYTELAKFPVWCRFTSHAVHAIFCTSFPTDTDLIYLCSGPGI